MLKISKKLFRKYARLMLIRLAPEIRPLIEGKARGLENSVLDSEISTKAQVAPPYYIKHSVVEDYCYIAQGARIQDTTIGRFCSIGPNLLCGWGIHPLDGLSTSPMFYSTKKQNGVTLSSVDKFQENKPIYIGNDVFIGMNVIILDGVKIGDGAVIGAGAVVSKDIPPFAIAYGNPIQVRRFRFNDKQREALLRIRWWMPDFPAIEDVENLFFDVDGFIQKHDPAKKSD